MGQSSGLDAWFLHEKLVCNLFTDDQLANLAQRMPDKSHPLYETFRMDVLEKSIADYLSNSEIPSLAIEQQRGILRAGQLVWLEQAISFKGAGASWTAVRTGKNTAARAEFTARLDTNNDVRVKGDYSAARLTCSSAPGQLSGTNRQFILGYVTGVEATEIGLRPIVIARRWNPMRSNEADWLGGDSTRVWPSMIDQFSHVDFRGRPSKSELELLKGVPQEAVRQAFAEILGEPDVPEVSGDEQLVFWTQNRLSIEGSRLRAAVAFKWPAKFFPMTTADLGETVNQVDMLSKAATDLIVMQHCHAITAQVVNLLKAHAGDPRNSRKYMTIDGYDTLRILRSSNFKF